MRKTVRNTRRPENDALRIELRRLREKAGMSQRELASKIGRTYAYVWKVESGAQHIDFATLLDFVAATGGDILDVAREIRDEFSNKAGI